MKLFGRIFHEFSMSEQRNSTKRTQIQSGWEKTVQIVHKFRCFRLVQRSFGSPRDSIWCRWIARTCIRSIPFFPASKLRPSPRDVSCVKRKETVSSPCRSISSWRRPDWSRRLVRWNSTCLWMLWG